MHTIDGGFVIVCCERLEESHVLFTNPDQELVIDDAKTCHVGEMCGCYGHGFG